MTPRILGLDVGGANLKAAAADGRAVSVPFPLWKQPDRLPAVLAELAGRFPEADAFAVTMTGELCDCFENKRQGVNAILDAVEGAGGGAPVRVWATDGRFVDVAAARAEFRALQHAGLDPDRFVFLDETWVKTNMTRPYGWGPTDRRLVESVPHGHWLTTTFVAALRADGLFAPLVVDGAMTGDIFRAWVEQHLVHALRPGDIVLVP